MPLRKTGHASVEATLEGNSFSHMYWVTSRFPNTGTGPVVERKDMIFVEVSLAIYQMASKFCLSKCPPQPTMSIIEKHPYVKLSSIGLKYEKSPCLEVKYLRKTL
jgi:hypothetical protein